MAAGTATITETTHSSVKKIKFAWTSGTAGESIAATTTAAFDGKVIALVTVPAGGGSAPTDDYDLTVADSDSLDVLIGAGANRDTADTEMVGETSLGAVAGSRLTFTAANAGNSKSGTAYLYIR